MVTAPRPGGYQAISQDQNARPLFKSDAAVLTDADIERILNNRLALPRRNRIAVLNLSSTPLARFHSSDIVHLNEAFEREFIGVLNGLVAEGRPHTVGEVLAARSRIAAATRRAWRADAAVPRHARGGDEVRGARTRTPSSSDPGRRTPIGCANGAGDHGRMDGHEEISRWQGSSSR